MSLTAAERARTSAELRANLELSGLTASQAGAALGFSARQLDEALSVSPARVWLLRDYLEQRVRAAGGSPVACTVLTEQARQLAAGWFGVQPPPGV